MWISTDRCTRRSAEVLQVSWKRLAWFTRAVLSIAGVQRISEVSAYLSKSGRSRSVFSRALCLRNFRISS